MAAKRINKRDIATNELAERVEKWASDNSVTNDPYIKGLVSALRERRNLHIYAEIAPLEFLPHPKSRIKVRETSLVRLLTLIRNVLVFAPVALTWAAVSAATTGFEAYTRENGASVVNFLDFWQNGYDILADHWKIGEVAKLDFILVAIVIALTLFVSIVGHRAHSARNHDEERLDEERADLALEISTLLYDKKKLTNITMNSSLAGSISRLVNASQSLESAAKAIAKASRA